MTETEEAATSTMEGPESDSAVERCESQLAGSGMKQTHGESQSAEMGGAEWKNSLCVKKHVFWR